MQKSKQQVLKISLEQNSQGNTWQRLDSFWQVKSISDLENFKCLETISSPRTLCQQDSLNEGCFSRPKYLVLEGIPGSRPSNLGT